MNDLLRDHFWACWWLILLLGWGVTEAIQSVFVAIAAAFNRNKQ